jgi:hypothetical protein
MTTQRRSLALWIVLIAALTVIMGVATLAAIRRSEVRGPQVRTLYVPGTPSPG